MYTAYDYQEAQNRVSLFQPEIVLCDIEMPRGSGLDLLRWLRENDNSCEMYTIFIKAQMSNSTFEPFSSISGFLIGVTGLHRSILPSGEAMAVLTNTTCGCFFPSTR